MVDGYLTFDDGLVQLGGDILPGILIAQSIRGEVRFDEAEADGVSGTHKTPLGWSDADISLSLDLPSDEQSDCYDKLTVINRIFKGADNGANPRVYTVSGRHLRARGIDQVVFSGLDSEEDDQTDLIRVRLAFIEHVPVIVHSEQQAIGSDQPLGAAPGIAAAEPKADSDLLQDTDPFSAGLAAGQS